MNRLIPVAEIGDCIAAVVAECAAERGVSVAEYWADMRREWNEAIGADELDTVTA